MGERPLIDLFALRKIDSWPLIVGRRARGTANAGRRRGAAAEFDALGRMHALGLPVP